MTYLFIYLFIWTARQHGP